MENTTNTSADGHGHDGHGHDGHGHDGHGHGHDGHGYRDDDESVQMHIDGAATMLPLFAETLDWVREFVAERALTVRRVVDVGAGPGVGTAALGDAFPDAQVVAADASENMLAAAAKRFADRPDRLMSTMQVDLSGELATLGEADVIWASLVLHHLGNETSTMRKLGDQLTADGLLVVVEFGNDMSFMPSGGAEEALVQRIATSGRQWIAEMRTGLPDAVVSSDYPTMIVGAGLQLLGQRLVEIDIAAPLDDAARRVVLSHLRRMRPLVADRMDPADIAIVDALIDPDDPNGVMQRDDLSLRDSRWVYVVAKSTTETAR